MEERWGGGGDRGAVIIEIGCVKIRKILKMNKCHTETNKCNHQKDLSLDYYETVGKKNSGIPRSTD
jgi:hypothetical protein